MSGGANHGSNDSRHLYEARRLDAIAARWDAKAESWDRELAMPGCHLNEDDGYSRFLQLTLNAIVARKKFCAAHGVIDAGCGTGLILEEVLSAFAWGLGVDISPEMIRVARQKHLPGAQFEVGDCFNLRACDLNPGAVLSRGVLLSHYSVKNGLALLRSAREVLAPGGFLIFDFLNLEALARHRHVPENKTYFDPKDVVALAAGAGFGRAQILGEPNRRVLLLLAEGD